MESKGKNIVVSCGKKENRKTFKNFSNIFDYNKSEEMVQRINKALVSEG